MEKAIWTVRKLVDALERLKLTHQHFAVHAILIGGEDVYVWAGGDNVRQADCIQIGLHGVVKRD